METTPYLCCFYLRRDARRLSPEARTRNKEEKREMNGTSLDLPNYVVLSDCGPH